MSNPLDTPGWIVARRLLGLLLVTFGAFFLLVLSVVWCAAFESLYGGLGLLALLTGLAILLLGAGFSLLGPQHRGVFGGVVFIGTGLCAALVAIVLTTALAGELGDSAPAGFDSAETRAVAMGSAISAFFLFGVGIAIAAPPSVRLFRQRKPGAKPILVWVILLWHAQGFVGVLMSQALINSDLSYLPWELRNYITANQPLTSIFSIVTASLFLAASIFLVRRHRAALWLFVAASVLGALGQVVMGLPPGVLTIIWIPTLVLGHALNLTVIGYTWWLWRWEVLK